MLNLCKKIMSRYLRRKAKAASERARARANRRWELDRERRGRLAEMERAVQERFVVVLIDRAAGDSRSWAYRRDVYGEIEGVIRSRGEQ